MPASKAQQEWVERVLGVRPAGTVAGSDFPQAWRAAVAEWRDASDAVDSQITALQRALKASGDGELEDIAEYGLNGVTGGFKVPLMAVLQELDPASPDPRLLKRARTIVSGFRSHLGSDQRVLACDENPFGVRVALRATLDPALGRLNAAIQLAVG